MAGRLVTILEKEYKTKGAFAGLASAGSKRLREMFDIRNLLFSGSGLTSIVGRKIFGKGYSATSEPDKISKGVTPTSIGSSIGFQNDSVTLLSSIKKDTTVSAKNSIVLPQMARDMNLTKQNIMRLVKIQGGTAATRADMFFKRAAERESDYERRVGKMGTLKSPTQLNKQDAFGLQGTINAILAAVGLMIAANWEKVEPYYQEIKGTLYKILLALGALYVAKGALSMPRPVPVPPTGGPGPAPSPTPGTPGAPGKPGTPTPGKPGTTGAPGGRSTTPGGPATGGAAGGAERSKVIERIKSLMKSPKAMAKFGAIMAKRGLGWIATAILFSGPVGWVITALLAAMAVKDIMDIIDEAFKDDEKEKGKSTTPTNVLEERGDMASLIYNRFREAGFSDVQAKAAVANAMRESNLDPNAHNTNGEDSVGLFQMNRKGGLGQGYTVEQLKDPETNIQLAIAAAKKSKSFGQASTIEDATAAFVKDVERPKDKIGETQKRIEIAQNLNTRFPGESIGTASVGLSDANRTLAMAPASQVINQDNRTITNQNTSMAHGSANPFAYDRELVQSLLGQAT